MTTNRASEGKDGGKISPRRGRTWLRWIGAFLCATGLLIDVAGPSVSKVYEQCGHVEGALFTAAELYCSLPLRDRSAMLIGLTVLLALFFRALEGYRARGGASAWVVSALFSAAMLFGWSFDSVGDARLVTGDLAACVRTLACGAAWTVVVHACVCALFGLFDRARGEKGASQADAMRPSTPMSSGRGFLSRVDAALRPQVRRWVRWAFDAHPLRGAALSLAVLWLPVLLGYAPALFMWDTDTQILQWFNLPNHLSDSVELLDPSVLLTQHHPPLHTALVGLCVQAGLLVGNENLGIFLYALLQWTVDILAIAWAMHALAAFEVPRRARVAAFAFIALVPAFSNYSVLVTKDVLFAAALLVYVVELVYLVRGVPSAEGAHRAHPWSHVALLVISALGVTLLRSGMVVAVVAGTVVALCLAPGRRRFAVGALAACLAVSLLLSRVVYPALSITPTSQREMLSIPFQQVARFMRDNPDKVGDEDRAIIDEVLDADTIAGLYDPIISDPVKATFRVDATSEELAAFFGVWARWFAEDPACYLTATAANYYGYFYPGWSMNWSYPSSFSHRAMANTKTTLTYSDIGSYFDFQPAANPVSWLLDGWCSLYRSAFQYLPPLTLTMQAALYDWALVVATAYAVSRRLPWLGAALAPCWLVLLVSLVGPCNATTYFRYAYPVALVMPWALALMASRLPLTAVRAPDERKAAQGEVRDVDAAVAEEGCHERGVRAADDDGELLGVRAELAGDGVDEAVGARRLAEDGSRL